MVKRSKKSKKKAAKREEEDIELDYGFSDEEPAVKKKLSLPSTISIDPAVLSTDASTDPAVLSTDASTDPAVLSTDASTDPAVLSTDASTDLKSPISDYSTTKRVAVNRDARTFDSVGCVVGSSDGTRRQGTSVALKSVQSIRNNKCRRFRVGFT